MSFLRNAVYEAEIAGVFKALWFMQLGNRTMHVKSFLAGLPAILPKLKDAA